jgi:prophage antirepressor-like protein
MGNSIVLTGFELALTDTINHVPCEFYRGRGFNGAITRERLGEALGYKNPRIAISKIHREHKERLDARSTVSRSDTVDGKIREVVVYSLKGALEVCRWSRQPAADAVMDALYDVLEKLLTQGQVSIADRKILSQQRQIASHEKAIAKMNARITADTL